MVGGGNVAVEEAGYLTRFASKVYIIHRREEFRADRHAIEQALSNPKIEPIWNSVVESIEGEGLVEKLVLKNVKTGEVSDLPVAGVFIFVGTEPNVSYLGEPGSVVKQTRGGWIDTNDKMETSVEGIFAAGDIRNVSASGRNGCRGRSSCFHGSIFHHNRTAPTFRTDRPRTRIRTPDIQHRSGSDKPSGRGRKVLGESGVKIALIDGYRNAKMVEKTWNKRTARTS